MLWECSVSVLLRPCNELKGRGSDVTLQLNGQAQAQLLDSKINLWQITIIFIIFFLQIYMLLRGTFKRVIA